VGGVGLSWRRLFARRSADVFDGPQCLGRTSPEGFGPGHGVFLSSNGGDFLSDLVDLHNVVLVHRPILAGWRGGFLSGTANGHDDLFLHGAKEDRGGVGDLLVHVESDVNRVDVGFCGEGGL